MHRPGGKRREWFFRNSRQFQKVRAKAVEEKDSESPVKSSDPSPQQPCCPSKLRPILRTTGPSRPKDFISRHTWPSFSEISLSSPMVITLDKRQKLVRKL